MIPVWQPTAAFFRHILSEKADAETIVAALRRHSGINLVVRDLLAEINTEKSNHQFRIQEITKKIMTEQARCFHAETRYDADPAGGSDSTTECLICGKILK